MRLYASVTVALVLAGSGCKFDPAGANRIDFSADAGFELPDADETPDADEPAPPDAEEPAPPDAAPPDAVPPDAADIPLGCGDGVVEAPEQCDDHNTHGDDGCSPVCRWEPGTCYEGAQLAPLVPDAVQSGSTTAQSSGLSGGGVCGGGTSGEDVFTFELSERADVVVTTALPGTSFNTAVYVRSDCNDASTQLACVSLGALGDTVNLPDLEPGSYFAIVDGFGGASGDYQVRLTVRPIRSLGAACDPFGEENRCADGLSCQASDAAGHGVCVEPSTSCVAGATSVTLAAAGSNVQSGTTAGADADYAPKCAATGSGPEAFFRAVVPAGSTRDLVLDVQSTSALDPIAELTTECGQSISSVACAAASSGSAALAVVNEVAPGEYFAVVDGSNGSDGSFEADFYLRPVLAAGAACDRHVRENRCGGAAVCVDGADFDAAPTCSLGVPVVNESSGNNASCNQADGPRAADFVYSAQISGAGDADVVELRPSPIVTRIVASVLGPGGSCPLDLALVLERGECDDVAEVARSSDEGLGPCPYIDATVPPGTSDPYWLTITRAGNVGTGSYTMVVDFIP